MKVKNITEVQLTECLNNVNKKHGYKLIFNRYPEKQGNFLVFTIRSGFSGIPGARTSHSGRNMVSASWHSHGYLFDEILENYPNAIIKVSGMDDIYCKNGVIYNNWQDRNIGSNFHPCRFSETSIL